MKIHFSAFNCPAVSSRIRFLLIIAFHSFLRWNAWRQLLQDDSLFILIYQVLSYFAFKIYLCKYWSIWDASLALSFFYNKTYFSLMSLCAKSNEQEFLFISDTCRNETDSVLRFKATSLQSNYLLSAGLAARLLPLLVGFLILFYENMNFSSYLLIYFDRHFYVS